MSLNAPDARRGHLASTAGTHRTPKVSVTPRATATFFAGDHWYQDANGVWKCDAKGAASRSDPRDREGHPAPRSGLHRARPRRQHHAARRLGRRSRVRSRPTATPSNANPAMRWDIHDEMVDQFGNAATSGSRRCRTASQHPTTTVENVSRRGPTTRSHVATATRRSRATGVTTSQSHDPLAVRARARPPARSIRTTPSETLLPDGQLNAGDAPMPAARIDFSIAANTNPLTSTDGVGSLRQRLARRTIYSMDDNGSNAVAGTCSRRSTRSTSRRPRVTPFGYASGVDGALITNNFPGFLTYGTRRRTGRRIPLGDVRAALDDLVPPARLTPYRYDARWSTQTVCRLHGRARRGPRSATCRAARGQRLLLRCPQHDPERLEQRLRSDRASGARHLAHLRDRALPVPEGHRSGQAGQDDHHQDRLQPVRQAPQLLPEEHATTPATTPSSTKIIVAHAQDIDGSAVRAARPSASTQIGPADGTAVPGPSRSPAPFNINQARTARPSPVQAYGQATSDPALRRLATCTKTRRQRQRGRSRPTSSAG